MALTKNTAAATAAAPAATGAFEDMEDTAVKADAPKSETPKVDVDTAKVEATKATAQAAASSSKALTTTPANTALSQALKANTALDDLQNLITPDMLESMGFGAFPRITVDQGGFSRNKTEFLGHKIEIEVQSWNFVTLVTAGEKDNKEADKLVRSSYDGINIPAEGCTVDEYIRQLRNDGYDKASAKKYIEIYASLLWTEKLGQVDADDVKLVQVSVSPQSAAQWGRYLLESRIKAARGGNVASSVVIGAERKTLGSNTFGVMNFGVKK